MLKTKITKTKKEFGITKVTVEFSDGKNNVVAEETFQLTEVQGLEGLKKVVKKRVSELDVQTTPDEAKIKVGDLDLSDQVTPNPTPTPEEIKRSEYNDKLEKLRKMKSFVDLGVLEKTDIQNLQIEVKNLAIELGEI